MTLPEHYVTSPQIHHLWQSAFPEREKRFYSN